MGIVAATAVVLMAKVAAPMAAVAAVGRRPWKHGSVVALEMASVAVVLAALMTAVAGVAVTVAGVVASEMVAVAAVRCGGDDVEDNSGSSGSGGGDIIGDI